MEEFKKAALSALAELLRIVVLSAIPVAVTMLESNGEIDMKVLMVVAAIAGLRFIDKLLHKYGKVAGKESLIKGIVRF